MFNFTTLEVEVSTTGDRIISATQGKEVMRQTSEIAFLNKLGTSSVQRRDKDVLSLETKHKIDITIHPNGAFHFEAEKVSLDALSLIEKWSSTIALAFSTVGRKNIRFDVDFHSHTDIQSRTQLAGISRIFNSLKMAPPLKGQPSTDYVFVVSRVRPSIASVNTMNVAYHREFLDLFFNLKPLSPQAMKNRYLITPAEALISVASSTIGEE